MTTYLRMQKKSAFMLAATIILAIVYSYFVIVYKKWFAVWVIAGVNVNVMLVGIPLAIISALIMVKIFKALIGEEYLFKNWAIGLMVVSFGACICLGLQFTEPKLENGWDGNVATNKTDYNDNYRRYSHNYFFFVDSDTSSSGGSDLNFDEDIGEGIAYILLILFVVIMVVLSALITHFWIIGALCMLTILVTQTIRQFEMEGGDLFEEVSGAMGNGLFKLKYLFIKQD